MVQNSIFPNFKKKHWKHEMKELPCVRLNCLSKQQQQQLLNNV